MPLVGGVDGDTGDVAVGHRVTTGGNRLEVELVPAAPDVRDQPAVEAGLGDVTRPARATPDGVALTARDTDCRDRVARSGIEHVRPVAGDRREALRRLPEELAAAVQVA